MAIKSAKHFTDHTDQPARSTHGSTLRGLLLFSALHRPEAPAALPTRRGVAGGPGPAQGGPAGCDLRQSVGAIALNGSDAVARRSIDRATVEMLHLPVPARQCAKALIDTVVWRMGDGLGALLLLIALKVFGLTTPEISVVVMALVAVWIVTAIAARGHYVHSLRASIYEHRLDAERLSVQTADRSTTDVLVATLNSSEPKQILYALNLLEHSEPPTSDPAVSRLLGHQMPAVRRKAISCWLPLMTRQPSLRSNRYP